MQLIMVHSVDDDRFVHWYVASLAFCSKRTRQEDRDCRYRSPFWVLYNWLEDEHQSRSRSLYSMIQAKARQHILLRFILVFGLLMAGIKQITLVERCITQRKTYPEQSTSAWRSSL